jgi:zinc D-Ala-D-Ala carboxypeptidase
MTMPDMIEATHWSDIQPEQWRWPNFSPAELASKGDGSLRLSCASMDRLQALRVRLGVPMLITSAYRDPEHNRRVGGAKASYHMRGMAFDVRVDNIDPARLIAEAGMEGFRGFGTYPRQGFVHIDTREDASSWGDPFPARETRFAAEPLPRPKTQAVKEGGAVMLAVTAAEKIVNDATPFLPAHWVSGAFVALGVVSLGVVLWRAFGRRGVVE